jgi:hypothetical protein
MVMVLEHSDLPLFEPDLRKWADLALGALSRLMVEQGIAPPDLPKRMKDSDFQGLLAEACHRAFREAQQLIGEALVENELSFRASKIEIADLRRQRKSVDRLLEIQEVRTRRALVLRRLMDAILFHLIGARPWMAKRLMIDEEVRPVDPEAARDALKFAQHRNAERLDRFSLVADITTTVQICDLIEIERGKETELRLIELKSGSVNERLVTAFKTPDKSVLHKTLTELGPSGLHQAERMLRQMDRNLKAVEAHKTDRATDPISGKEVVIGPEVHAIETYGEILEPLVARAREDGLASVKSSGCLRVLAVRAEVIAKLGRGGLAHLIYHQDGSTSDCLLGSANESHEVAAVRSLPPLVNLADNSLRAVWTSPLFLWPMDPNSLMDLLCGRIVLFAQFDAERFRLSLNERGLTAVWESRSKSAEFKKEGLSDDIFGAPPGIAAMRVGGENPRTYMSGFFTRVYVDLWSVQDLVRVIENDQRAPNQSEDRG